MTASSIYRLKTPTVWSEGPDVFSFSSLSSIEQCSLQWQLIHSTYGELSRFPSRPTPAAVEGDIVHHMLDRLFKEMSFAGLPPIGSSAFADVIASVNIRAKVEQLILEHENRISCHPRGGGFRLRLAPQELVNRIVRLFRVEYPKASPAQQPVATVQPMNISSLQEPLQLLRLLQEKGALSEVRLLHPSLQFTGILDLVRISSKIVTIVDFKTGSPKTAHKDQLLYYAVLWWRNTGEAPASIEVRYPGIAELTHINQELLQETEVNLAKRIVEMRTQLRSSPAPARLGDHCQYCDVRQFCGDYWTSGGSKPLTAKRKVSSNDIELVIDSPPSNNGFFARYRGDVQCSVVYSTDGIKVHGPFETGQKLRILNARISDDGSTVELMPWSEVFHA